MHRIPNDALGTTLKFRDIFARSQMTIKTLLLISSATTLVEPFCAVEIVPPQDPTNLRSSQKEPLHSVQRQSEKFKNDMSKKTLN